jgi:hypothetical protein
MMLTTLLSRHVDNQSRLSYFCILSIGCKLVYVHQLNLANKPA